MPVKIVSGLLTREYRSFIAGLAVLTLWIAGYAHMAKLGFGLRGLMDSPREYLLLCAAGALFGWLFKDAAAGFARELLLSPSRLLFPWPYFGYLLSPVAFIVVLHQFRYFLNDGPASIAMGFGLLANLMTNAAGRARNAGVSGATALLEAGDSDDGVTSALLRCLYEQDRYSPVLLGHLARLHEKRGNRFKAALALSLMESTGREDD